ncbi:alpha-L-fucosidase [Candidatus Poribacteria bacterium]
MSADKFQPTVESLRAYQCPEWFRDAKFGIYLHWGVYSVAERGEWYARQMYIEGDPVYEHHVKAYGHPSEFGYRKFIPMWRAENFDPDRLVGLFKQAGARYFTPCVIHHDNFDLWNSRHHKWNSVNMGPKKDITEMWRDAALRHGLRFGVTTHLERSYSWFNVNKGADKAGPMKGVPYDGNDPKYQDFYHEPHDDTDLRHPKNPPESWRRIWTLRIKDLLDHYHPDLLYFDGAIPFQGDDQGKTGLEMLAYYYNQNMRWHDGKQECVMFIKNISDHGFYYDGIATLDIEGHKSDEMLPEPWQTDMSIGPWGYRAGAKYRSAGQIVHELVEIVSRNGNLLLNVPPKADGTLDEETKEILSAIGQWMNVNEEAIYDTRPWIKYGEGNLRFTQKGKNLYVMALELPNAGESVNVSALGGNENVGKVSEVALLGHIGKVEWAQKGEGLTITAPDVPPCEHVYSFRVGLE